MLIVATAAAVLFAVGSALGIFARLQEVEIQRTFALLLICQNPCPEVIIFVQEDEIRKRERNSGIPT